MSSNSASPIPLAGSLPVELARHAGFAQVFQPDRLTFGLIMPLEGYPDSPFPTLENHVELAVKADQAGFATLWMRDVPFYDPTFGDTGQMLDPMVYLGFLAAYTRRIALGTTGIVLPLRDPLIVAKQATSVDQLTNGRFILGLSSGDRAVEYPAFGVNHDNRGERYREAFSIIRTVSEEHFPTFKSEHYGEMRGSLELIPRPVASRVPTIVVGRARQDIAWIAKNSDGWIWHISDFARLPEIIRSWREAGDGKTFKPYGYATFFDLDENPNLPLQRGSNGVRIGRNALIDLWKQQEALGISHVALNLKPLRRPAAEAMEELAEYVLPHFPAGKVARPEV
ncbi:luciferase-type oxidoreductase [Paraburkholderia sp. BL27I4N3]|uniref:LLM class oxidoreductase n=1 Tax=Paraburkholderia sp. BL27I4N3 TaxID=1938805 RepID=UPI000E2287AF|nr:LLM class oxidoreductase [Paraburkholderia sp. BL27I4N3]REE07124.1 luciferase-type oxidoreductase [Paraburkholderia sp. BL27I4N3]